MDLGLVTFADLPPGLSPEQRMRNLLEEEGVGGLMIDGAGGGGGALPLPPPLIEPYL